MIDDDDDDLTDQQKVEASESVIRLEFAMAAMVAPIDEAAECARKLGANGLALSALLLKESLLVYCAELRRYSRSMLD